jgi:HYR domain
VSTAVVSFAVPIGTDNCPGPSTKQTSILGTGSTFPIDESTDSYLVTDGSGNASSCSFVVDVVDDEILTASCILGVNPVGNKPGSTSAGFFHNDNRIIDKPGLKAFVIDTWFGTRFPLAGSGLDHFVLGTRFKYTIAKGAKPQQKRMPGVVGWHLTGKRAASYVIIEDEAGNISLPAFCP